MGFTHASGIKPQIADVVEADVDVVVGEVVVVVLVEVDVVLVVVDGVVVVVVVPGGEPHPTRFALTMMSSNRPPIVVAAPPKLSTPNPIQSRDCGNARPEGTPEPMPLGESQTTGVPDT